MDSTATILWSLLFGSIGLGYFIYGRRQDHKVALLAGVALMSYTYFVDSALAMVAVGCALMALPYFLKL
ncbi:MAG: hypothetical protein OEW92_04625 [Gammaproteobacteria bacterium]|nr:hypothetical protein [Gammaproteobacteria bacterium]MDH5171681.1 hypothetical protein [Gammaproteobacteria bacterium]